MGFNTVKLPNAQKKYLLYAIEVELKKHSFTY